MKLEINPADYFVLVCDDEESIRSMLSEVLKDWGFPFATAPNGEAAMEFIQQGNVPHIILTDIRMGGITGIELAEKAKQVSDEIEVVIMTSHGTLETAVQAMRIGVFDYLTKPFENIQDVRNTLVHVCERIYLRLYNEYLIQALQGKNQEIEYLAQTTAELAQNLDPQKTLEISCQGLSRAWNQAHVAFFQFFPSQKALMATLREPSELFGKTQPKLLIPEKAFGNMQKMEEHFRSLEKDAAFLRLVQDAARLTPEPVQKPKETPWRFAPMVTRGIARGIFALQSEHWDDENSPPLLKRYMQTVSTAFENALLHQKVVEVSITDGLTALFNVRHFRQRLAEQVQTATRLHHPLSLLFFDVDHFKKYNDTNGHQAGDECLKLMAKLIKLAFRQTDICARYGGEEFVVLMPHTSFADALQKAEAFRQLVAKTPFPNGEKQPLGLVSVSIGVAEYPTHGSTGEDIVRIADEALYEGKKKSRNVVCSGVVPQGHVPAFKVSAPRTRSIPTASAPSDTSADDGGIPGQS